MCVCVCVCVQVQCSASKEKGNLLKEVYILFAGLSSWPAYPKLACYGEFPNTDSHVLQLDLDHSSSCMQYITYTCM